MMLQKVARWSVAHRRRVITGWVAIAVLTTLVAGSIGRDYATNFTLPGTESQRASDLLTREFKAQSGDADTIVFHVSHGTIDAPAVRAAIAPMLARVSTFAHVSNVTSPYSARGALQVSHDRATAFATVDYDRQANLLSNSTGTRVLDQLKAVHVPGLSVAAGGQVIENAEGFSVGSGDHRRRDCGVGDPAADVRLPDRGRHAADHRGPWPDHGRFADRARHPRHEHVQRRARARADDRAGRRDRLRTVHRHPVSRELRLRGRRKPVGARCDGHLRARDPARRRDRGDRAPRHVRHGDQLHVRPGDRLGAGGAVDARRVADTAAGAAVALWPQAGTHAPFRPVWRARARGPPGGVGARSCGRARGRWRSARWR